MSDIIEKLFIVLHRIVRGVANRILDKKKFLPRQFSNSMIKLYAPKFTGDVINVSGWDDRDRESGFYKDYFTNCSNYYISNGPTEDKGFGSVENQSINEIEIDLNTPLPQVLQQKFDVVFNHTTLEHILNIQTAFKNLCDLSKDAVIIIVPAIQNIHISESFGDYWRMTTMGVAKMLIVNGFTPIIITCNDQPFAPVYCFAIGVRSPEKYKGIIDNNYNFEMGAKLYGSSMKKEWIEKQL